MKDIPNISVIMSIYNENETQIKESVCSILNQTYDDFELIVICDNPNRNDVNQIFRAFQDDRITLVYNSHNIGLALSMNKAASLAKAEIVARMDADDIALPTRFEDEYKIIINEGVDVVFSNYSFIDNYSIELAGKKNSFPKSIGGNVASQIVAIFPEMIHHPTVMMKLSTFNKVGGYRNFPCSQDRDLWYRMQEAGARFYLLDKVLLKYRINPNSVTNQRFYQQQLTVHYINYLSLERLQKGRDSYSLDNYQSFIKKSGINSNFKKSLFVKGAKLLDKAAVASKPIRYIYRLLAFVISPQLRHNYIICYRKKLFLMRLC